MELDLTLSDSSEDQEVPELDINLDLVNQQPEEQPPLLLDLITMPTGCIGCGGGLDAPGSGNNVNIYNSNGTLSSERTLSGGGQSLILNQLANFYVRGVLGIAELQTSDDNSFIVRKDGATESMVLKTPNLYLEDLTNLTSQTRLIGQDGATDKIGFITLDSSLSLVDGELSVAPLTNLYWGLLGNSGTSASTNFIGTTDGQALQIKVNNERAGFIGYSGWPYTETSNGGATSFGYKAAEAWTNRLGNFVAIGSFALQNLASSGEDVAIGNWSLRNQTGGDPTESYQSRNVAVGQSSLFYQTIGSHNTAVGTFAGEVNRNGKYMTAIGSNALRGNKQGIGNTGVGYFSLLRNTSGVGSVTITNGGSGYTTATVTFSSPEANTPGTVSTLATGTAVLSAGAVIGITITNPGSGYSIEPSGVTVTITGDGSGATGTVSLISGEYNTAIGVASLAYNRFGDYNTAIGTYAGYSGRYVYEDTNSTFLGANAGIDSSVLVTTVLTNATAIGYNSRVGASNSLVLGGTGGDAVNVGINTISPRKKLDVVGDDMLIYELTVGRGGGGAVTNTAFGLDALLTNSTGTYNTAIGWNSIKLLTAGLLKTAVGANALTGGGGDYDSAFGANSLWQATTGSTRNTGVGYGSLFSLTTGTNNIGIGYGGGFSIITGDYNVALGMAALGSGAGFGGVAKLSGDDNIGIGRQAGYNITTSSTNIFIGYLAGQVLTTESSNVIIGGNDGTALVGLSNHVILADGAGNQRLLINSNGAYSIGGGYGTAGYVLTSNGTGSAPTWTAAGGSTSPGGSDTEIQFNDSGSFGGDAGLTFNKTTNILSTNNGAFRPTGTISFSDAGAGSVYKSSSDGLVLRAVTGSGYDFMIYDAAGNGVFGMEAGTSKLGSTSQMGPGLLGYGGWNAWLNIRGGTTTNASITIRDGVAPSSPAEGQIWRTTDKVYNVIQTGAATKEFTLNDIALTSGRIPYTTTNGRLTDVSTFVVNSGNVGIGTGSPSASALLDVSSTTKGALMPRMTTTQRDAISSPATGLELFNTTTNTKQIYDGTRWVEAAHPLYKVYTALLTQSGTDAPTATVLENNLGGTVVWTRDTYGLYTATLSGAFTSGKTWFTPQLGQDGFMISSGDALRFIRTSSDAMSLNTTADDYLNAFSIEIRVYY